MMRLLVVILVSALFGLLCRYLASSGKKGRLYLNLAYCALSGLVGASLLCEFFPVLFDHLFYYESWFEWLEFVGSGYACLLLPRSLILVPLGYLAGYLLAGSWIEIRASLGKLSPLAFLAGFMLAWACQAEHLPRGVESKVYVYRIAGSQYDANDSEQWVRFLEWNWSPYFGYKTYSTGLSLSLFSGEFKLEIGKEGPPTYVFVKEYWKDGRKTSLIHASKSGQMTAGELASYFRNFARSRTSP